MLGHQLKGSRLDGVRDVGAAELEDHEASVGTQCFLTHSRKERQTAGMPPASELEDLLRGADLRVTRPRVGSNRRARWPAMSHASATTTTTSCAGRAVPSRTSTAPSVTHHA